MFAEKGNYPITWMAIRLNVSRSGYYSWLAKGCNNNVRSSCSRRGNCYDNAVAESFFATLKNEMYYRRSFSTRAGAKMAVINFIECYYNRQRPHSTINYKIPAQVMEDFFARTKPACSTIRKAA